KLACRLYGHISRKACDDVRYIVGISLYHNRSLNAYRCRQFRFGVLDSIEVELNIGTGFGDQRDAALRKCTCPNSGQHWDVVDDFWSFTTQRRNKEQFLVGLRI